MTIRYDPVFQDEIRRVVRNFNRKITKLEKQGRDLLPEKTSVKELKSSYDNRRELKRKLKQLQKFSTRNIEDVIITDGGVKMTKYDYEIRNMERIRALRRETLSSKQMRSRLQPMSITRRSAFNLSQERIKMLKKSINDLNFQQLKRLDANINRVLDYDRKNEQFQSNFFQVLFAEAGLSGVDEDVISNIETTLSDLTPEQLLKLYKEEPNIQAIMDYSPTKGNYITNSRMRDILGAINDKLPQIMKEYSF